MDSMETALKSLEQYRADEIAGLLIRLPVPLGAKVWKVQYNPSCHQYVREAETFLYGKVVTPRLVVEPVSFTLAMLDDWGKTVFATKSEGERKRGSKMENKNIQGHLSALLTIFIWGTTFISTKILLVDFQPVEILFFRFVIGLVALLLVYPHRLKGTSRQQELTFAAAGLCGICLYYLMENIALTYTMASNVGVIISVAPFFTALLSHLFLKAEKPKANFYIGFAVAMAGICLISFNGSKLELNPAGDLLALLAALIWACYSVLTKKISGYGYHTILTTRRIFCYGILFMIPTLFLFDFKLELIRFANPVYLFNIIFLGLGASALCFVTWNFAVKVLGAIKTSIYIYMVPVITVITSVVVLHEEITAMAAVGTVLTLAGLFLSESKLFLRKEQEQNGLAK